VRPEPVDVLLDAYRDAEAEFGIPWQYLAAIHLVETRLGRIRGNSSSGAQGPMQFIPSTWEAFGEGDVNDNRDAILAAGRYLKAAGGPANMDKAIFAYNHDDGYVTAVKAYAQNMLDDPRAYDGYYQWQVYYRTVNGTVLLPEGYTAGGPIGARALPPA
jgi:membrane-bound lytic murein transglycosylase MltF